MNLKGYLLILLWFCSASVTVSAGQTLTLQEALSFALAQNPLIRDARSQTHAAQARLQQIRAAYFPQVNVTGGYDHQWYEGLGGGHADDSRYSANLNLSQLLYDFGRTREQAAAGRHQLKGAEEDFLAEHLWLMREVKLAYWETLKKKALVAVSRSTLVVREQHLAQSQAMYQQGLRPKIDVTRQEVEVSRVQLDLTKTTYDLQSARVAFENLLGGVPLAGAYELDDTRPPVPPLAELSELTAQAMQQRPDIRSLESQVKAAQSGLQVRKNDRWPSLNGQASYRKSGEDLPLDESWNAGVVLRWEIFDGYAKTGKIAETLANLRSLEARRDRRRLAVVDEVTQAYLAVREIRDAIRTSRQAEAQAAENLAQAEGRYQAGVSTVIELNDAQVLYTESQNALVQITYDLLKAWAWLEYATAMAPHPQTG